MKKVIRIGLKRKPKVTSKEMALTSNLKGKVELIQALIPIGLGAVAEELKHEVEQLAGRRKHCYIQTKKTSRVPVWKRRGSFVSKEPRTIQSPEGTRKVG